MFFRKLALVLAVTFIIGFLAVPTCRLILGPPDDIPAPASTPADQTQQKTQVPAEPTPTPSGN